LSEQVTDVKKAMNVVTYVFIDDEECEEAKAKICRETNP